MAAWQVREAIEAQEKLEAEKAEQEPTEPKKKKRKKKVRRFSKAICCKWNRMVEMTSKHGVRPWRSDVFKSGFFWHVLQLLEIEVLYTVYWI